MKPTEDGKLTGGDMVRLVSRLLRPYRGWTAIILVATLIETPLTLAAPWPLTLTIDIIQDFVASATLSILVDVLAIIGMLSLMFWLNWDFALVAVAVAPLLLLFVARFRKAVKRATREVRHRQSDIVGVVQQGLESIRVVNAFGRQELEEKHLADASREEIKAALKARRVKSPLSPIIAVTVSFCTAFVLWRGASLVLASAMTVGSLTVFLSYLKDFFKPVKDLAKMSGTIAQAVVGMEVVCGISAISMRIP